jgi:hypothetical protein
VPFGAVLVTNVIRAGLLNSIDQSCRLAGSEFDDAANLVFVEDPEQKVHQSVTGGCSDSIEVIRHSTVSALNIEYILVRKVLLPADDRIRYVPSQKSCQTCLSCLKHRRASPKVKTMLSIRAPTTT